MSDAPRSLAAGMAVTPNVRLVSPLGSGGMGAVWLADHAGLKTRVVVKFMLRGGQATAAERARFAREAAAAAQVKSPHVVQMLDHGVTEDGIPFIVMEHLEGRDLGIVLKDEGALDPLEVVTIVSQVAKALGRVHAAGLLHRDIKPDNIFVCDNEDEIFVKLLDFGVAKREAQGGEEGSLDGSTNTGQVVGTPFYMSPEQVTAQKALDARSDVWSLGVVAFEALTGRRPFDGPSFGALAVLIATGTPPKPTEVNPSLPKEVDAWFLKACARDPAARFASARELAEGLRVAFGALAPPMSDSGQRSANPAKITGGASSRARSSPSNDPASGTPSFVNASTLESPSAGPLGATGSAVVDARAPSRADAKRRSHLVFGTVFALAGALVVALLFGGGDKWRGGEREKPVKPTQTKTPVAKTAPPASTTAPSAHPGPSAAPIASSSPAIVDAGASVIIPTNTVAPPATAVLRSAPRADAGAGAGATPIARPTPSASAAPATSETRPPLHPPPSHDDPLY